MRYDRYHNSGELHGDLVQLLPHVRKLASKQSPERSRELTMALTKLEEALLWTKAHIEGYRTKSPEEVDNWHFGWWKEK